MVIRAYQRFLTRLDSPNMQKLSFKDRRRVRRATPRQAPLNELTLPNRAAAPRREDMAAAERWRRRVISTENGSCMQKKLTFQSGQT